MLLRALLLGTLVPWLLNTEAVQVISVYDVKLPQVQPVQLENLANSLQHMKKKFFIPQRSRIWVAIMEGGGGVDPQMISSAQGVEDQLSPEITNFVHFAEKYKIPAVSVGRVSKSLCVHCF